MKKNYLVRIGFYSLFIFLISCNRDPNSFIIKGDMVKPAEWEIKLYKLTTESKVLIDSVKSTNEGKFELKGSTTYPAFYLLQYLDNENIYLIAKSGDEIKITIENSLERLSYYTEGSSECSLVRELQFRQDRVLKKIAELSNQYEKIKSDPETFISNKKKIDSVYASILDEHRDYSIEFIYDNPGALANILALYQNFGRSNQPLFDSQSNLDVFNFVDSNLTILYPHTEAVLALNKDVTRIKEQLKYNSEVEGRIEVGRLLPPIKDVAVNGDSVITGNLKREKYIVILFGATWNKPSVEALKHYNELSKKYNFRNCLFLMYSLDSSEEKLLEFIQTNNISIPVICDYMYWDSKYVNRFALQSIPSTLILNKDHRILVDDLIHTELEERITQLSK